MLFLIFNKIISVLMYQDYTSHLPFCLNVNYYFKNFLLRFFYKLLPAH